MSIACYVVVEVMEYPIINFGRSPQSGIVLIMVPLPSPLDYGLDGAKWVHKVIGNLVEGDTKRGSSAYEFS